MKGAREGLQLNYYYKYISSVKKLRKGWYILVSVLAAIMLIAFAFLRKWLLLVYGLILIGFEIFVYCFINMRQKKEIDKTWESSKYLEGGMRVIIKFFEDHFEQSHERGNVNLPYTMLFAVYETDHYFYMMISKSQAVIVEKAECSEELIQFIRNKVTITQAK